MHPKHHNRPQAPHSRAKEALTHAGVLGGLRDGACGRGHACGALVTVVVADVRLVGAARAGHGLAAQVVVALGGQAVLGAVGVEAQGGEAAGALGALAGVVAGVVEALAARGRRVGRGPAKAGVDDALAVALAELGGGDLVGAAGVAHGGGDGGDLGAGAVGVGAAGLAGEAHLARHVGVPSGVVAGRAVWWGGEGGMGRRDGGRGSGDEAGQKAIKCSRCCRALGAADSAAKAAPARSSLSRARPPLHPAAAADMPLPPPPKHMRPPHARHSQQERPLFLTT